MRCEKSIHVTNAVCVAHDGDTRIVFYLLHERVGPTRYDQIDDVV